MALGLLIGWGIVHFSLPTYLIFIAGAAFYILGGMITRARATSILSWLSDQIFFLFNKRGLI